MPWAKLSDDFHSHRSIRRAGLDGAGLFALALSYCAKYLTDGKVDEEWLAETVPNPSKRRALLRRLVELGLFERVEGGYYVPSYLMCNPTSDQVEAKRAAQREAGRRTAERRWGNRSSDSSSNGSSYDGLNAPSRTRAHTRKPFDQGDTEGLDTELKELLP